MARDSGTVPSAMSSKPALARCGLQAGILWYQGRGKCDGYGRLPGDPEVLAGEVLSNWCLYGGWTVDDVLAARNALVRGGLWILYTVGGREYIEYADYDSEQTESYLARRAARPQFPDPPDRTDLWAVNRPHRKGKGTDEPTGPSTGRQPHGSADLPAGTKAPVPSGDDDQAAEPGGDAEEETEEQAGPDPQMEGDDAEGFTALFQCHHHYRGGAAINTRDQSRIREIIKEARAAAVPWRVLLSTMKDLQIQANSREPKQTITSIGYYMEAWREKIRTWTPDGPTAPAGVPPAYMLPTQFSGPRPKAADEVR